jgi:hypothetical protein
MVYLVYQRESGAETGHHHFQGYCQMKRAERLAALKKLFPGAHLEIQRGTNEEAKEYCMKEDSRIDGPWEFGEFKPSQGQQGKRTDIEEIITAIREKRPRDEYIFTPSYVRYYRGFEHIKLLAQEPYNHDDVRGVWYWGPPGTGKSHTARTNFPEAFMKAQNKWFDGYNQQENIILDDFDTNGVCLGHHLKIWADKWACTGEFKGGTTQLCHKNFVITSNYSIRELFGGDNVLYLAILRRFKVTHFSECVFNPNNEQKNV